VFGQLATLLAALLDALASDSERVVLQVRARELPARALLARCLRAYARVWRRAGACRAAVACARRA
jgi:hypothetical protein